jgi:hypothetical protein
MVPWYIGRNTGTSEFEVRTQGIAWLQGIGRVQRFFQFTSAVGNRNDPMIDRLSESDFLPRYRC